MYFSLRWSVTTWESSLSHTNPWSTDVPLATPSVPNIATCHSAPGITPTHANYCNLCILAWDDRPLPGRVLYHIQAREARTSPSLAHHPRPPWYWPPCHYVGATESNYCIYLCIPAWDDRPLPGGVFHHIQTREARTSPSLSPSPSPPWYSLIMQDNIQPLVSHPHMLTIVTIALLQPEMIGHYLGEFSITYKPVMHGRLPPP